MPAPKDPIKRAKWIANQTASHRRYLREHPDAAKKWNNTPEVFALIQQYGHPLISLLRYKYHNLNYRCSDPNHSRYKDYGGRGIRNLFTSQLNFFNYVILELHITTFEQIRGLEIHRTNNDSHYMPGNIEFLTPQEHHARHDH